MLNFTFNHIARSVKDVDKSAEFYQKVFGFEEIPNTASNSKTRWFSIGGGKQLHIIPRPELEVKVNKAVHFALCTPDIEAFIEHLDSLKVEFVDWHSTPERNYVRQDGIIQFYFQDPDGYWIEVNNDPAGQQ